MIWPLKRARGNRVEQQAYAWLMKMLDDPARHGPGLERWLARNPEHRTVYQRAADAVGRASDTAVMRPHIRAAGRARKQSRLSWGLPVAAASLAVAIGIILLIYPGGRRGPASLGQRPAAVAKIFENDSGERTVHLSDGSEVILFGSTALAADMQSSQRLIELRRGHARFTVAHDANRPFVVNAGDGSVTAVGTIFEVTVGRRVDVHLIEGKVRVSYASAAEPKSIQKVLSTQGETLTYPAQSSPEAVTAVRPRGPRIMSFDDVPVSAVITATCEGAATKIELADPAIGSRKIFAEIDVSDPVAVATKLAKILDLSISRPSSSIILLEPKGRQSVP